MHKGTQFVPKDRLTHMEVTLRVCAANDAIAIESPIGFYYLDKEHSEELINQLVETWLEVFKEREDKFLSDRRAIEIAKKAIEKTQAIYGKRVKEQPYSSYDAEDMWHLARAWCILNRKVPE